MSEKQIREFYDKDFLTIMREIKKKSEVNKTFNLGKKNIIKVALLGTGSLQYFASMLKYGLNMVDVSIEVFIGTYKGAEIDIMDDDSEYYKFEPDITVIFTDYREILQFPDLYMQEEQVWKMVWEWMQKREKLWEKVNSRCGSAIFQTNFVIPLERQLGNLEENYVWSRQSYIELLNYALKIKKKKYVTIIDYNYLASAVGKRKWFDFSNYYLNKSNMSYECLPQAVREIALNILNYCGKYRKCIVLDLDNTLWGGVLEEVGIDGVNIFPDNPVGEAFLAFQKYLKDLKGRGIILAVCSKNDEEYAKEVFRKNDNMILKLDDISCFIANWENKDKNIQTISEKLNIGTDSMVFVDDNPVERNLVQVSFPEVEVVNLSEDPADYIENIENENYFEWLQITEEDFNRTATYIVQEEMKKAEKNSCDYMEYLNSLDMRCSADKLSEKNISRITQLFNKTNQFNTTGFRCTEAQLLNYQNKGSYIWGFQLKDKFVNYGIVSVLLYKIEQDECIITAWAMSCRVFKRTLEKFILNMITEKALKEGCKKILIHYLPTERNAMIKKILIENDFEFDKDFFSISITDKTYFQTNIVEVNKDEY